MSNKTGKRLVSALRFPEFRGGPEWQEKPLEDLISTVTPPKKIPTTGYLAKGTYPIVDQGQSDIAGWTNDLDALIKNDLPLVVFGDHTCALKLVNQPFAQGADGIKVIKGKQAINTEYLYQFLCFRPVVTEEYKRHFSILKTRVVAYPEKPSGEQQKIAACLSSLDDFISAQVKKIEALKAHKQGLMQQLFPAEGETLPRLRFPEFRDAPVWNKARIGDFKPFVTSGSRGWGFYYSDQGSLFIRITNLSRESIALDLTNSKFVKLPPGENEGMRTQIKKHDVLISITADIGIIGYVDENVSSPAYINQHIALVRFDTLQVCSKFVSYFLASETSQRLFRAATDNGAKAGMSLIAVQKIQIVLPSIAEQQKVADLLTSLDALITAHRKRLAVLKIQKQGLMQGLFPSMNEAEV